MPESQTILFTVFFCAFGAALLSFSFPEFIKILQDGEFFFNFLMALYFVFVLSMQNRIKKKFHKTLKYNNVSFSFLGEASWQIKKGHALLSVLAVCIYIPVLLIINTKFFTNLFQLHIWNFYVLFFACLSLSTLPAFLKMVSFHKEISDLSGEL